jgi:hypothetical protein
MSTTLNEAQRDALRKLRNAALGSGRYARDEAITAVLASFADALRPPKMATRWHATGDGIDYRVARHPDGKEEWEYRTVTGTHRDYEATDVVRARLAAARDTEFHEVTD